MARTATHRGRPPAQCRARRFLESPGDSVLERDVYAGGPEAHPDPRLPAGPRGLQRRLLGLGGDDDDGGGAGGQG